MPSRIEAIGSRLFDGTFTTMTRSPSIITRSVNVPPISTLIPRMKKRPVTLLLEQHLLFRPLGCCRLDLKHLIQSDDALHLVLNTFRFWNNRLPARTSTLGQLHNPVDRSKKK